MNGMMVFDFNGKTYRVPMNAVANNEEILLPDCQVFVKVEARETVPPQVKEVKMLRRRRTFEHAPIIAELVK